jgi:hypothetical protein
VAAGLTRLGRNDLAQSLAPPLAEAIVGGEVPVRRLGLTHASHLFRLLSPDEGQLRQDLALRLSRGDWLSTVPGLLSVYETAQALYSLWCYGPELMRFARPEPFRQRLLAELDSESRLAALQLWGAVSLICDDAIPRPGWLTSTFASELFDQPRWKLDYLLPGAMQSLLGLRAAATSGAELFLSEARIAALLTRLSATGSKTARQAEIIASLVTWLEESRGQGGKLAAGRLVTAYR